MIKRLAKISGLVLVALAGLAFAQSTLSDSIACCNIDEIIRTLSSRTDAASINLLSRPYYAIDQGDNAVKNGEKAVGIVPDSSMYHLWLGRQYGKKANASNPLSAASLAKKAKAEFEQTVKLDPANVQ